MSRFFYSLYSVVFELFHNEKVIKSISPHHQLKGKGLILKTAYVEMGVQRGQQINPSREENLYKSSIKELSL